MYPPPHGPCPWHTECAALHTIAAATRHVAIVPDPGTGQAVAAAMVRAYQAAGIPCTARVTTPDLTGARAV